MPDALVAAARIGITIPRSTGSSFRGIRFVSSKASVEAEFPNGAGVGIRRPVLHALLIEQALKAGAEVLWETPVTELRDSTVTAGGKRVQARWIIGADGSQSRTRRWCGLDSFRRNTLRYGFRTHFRVAPWSDFMEIYWTPRCQLYITSVTADEVCVAVISRDPMLRLMEAVRCFPDLYRRLSGVPTSTVERGGISATRKLKSVATTRVALIGDASGSVDAITGDGLCLSFQQAAALADALDTGDLRSYEAAHRQLSRRPAFMADFMLMMDRWPGLQSRVLPALASRPELFRKLLAIHVGKLDVRSFATTSLSLGWRMMRV